MEKTEAFWSKPLVHAGTYNKVSTDWWIFFYSRQKLDNMRKTQSDIPEPNEALKVNCIIIKYVLATEMEVEKGATFTNFQTGEYL